jgi:hypothetical protein
VAWHARRWWSGPLWTDAAFHDVRASLVAREYFPLPRCGPRTSGDLTVSAAALRLGKEPHVGPACTDARVRRPAAADSIGARTHNHERHKKKEKGKWRAAW